jgi:hypothetical protein
MTHLPGAPPPNQMTNEHHAEMLRLLDHQDQMSKARQEFEDNYRHVRRMHQILGYDPRWIEREEIREWRAFLRRKGLLK